MQKLQVGERLELLICTHRPQKLYCMLNIYLQGLVQGGHWGVADAPSSQSSVKVSVQRSTLGASLTRPTLARTLSRCLRCATSFQILPVSG
jgi:hypothetical protein